MKLSKELYPRQEVIKLSRINSSLLSRLDRNGVVCPTKLGSTAHPVVIYSANQIIQLRVIAKLRNHLTLKEIRKIVKYIQDNGFDTRFSNEFLIFYGNSWTWVESKETISAIVASRNSLVFKIVYPMGDIYSDLVEV